MKKNKSQEKFVKIYETRIKKYRDDYYRNIIKSTEPSKNLLYKDFLCSFIPLVISFLIIIVGKFDFKYIGFSFIINIFLNFFIALYRKRNNIYINNYIRELRKIGYVNIADYEAKIKEYITGPNGYYNQELESILQSYNITEEEYDTIIDYSGTKFLIWVDNQVDCLYLVNASLTSLPKVIKIKFSYIRYYRYDKKTDKLILKTDMEELLFRGDSLKVFDKLIKEKKFEAKRTFDPAEYINDFEVFMHQMREKVEIDDSNNKILKSNVFGNIFIYFIVLVMLIFIGYYWKDYKLLFNLIILLVFVKINKNLTEYFNIQNMKVSNDDDYIKYLNHNQDCLDRFNELKLSLNIPDDAAQIYSPEGACYLTWVANGYFHIFLNLVYFNVVYMAVKTSNVEYYNVKGNECIIRFKEKTLYFNKDAELVFKKILPNKDYSWIKGIN